MEALTALTPSLTLTGGIVLVIIFVGIIISRMYTRAEKDVAFVRTGTGGAKVVKDGGALVIPVIHTIKYVNLKTLKLEVERTGQRALIAKDRIRADVLAEFYVRVKSTNEDIKKAAETLGERTRNPKDLKSGHIEGKFVDALRAVAAKMNLDELHENREDFVQQVQATLDDDLSQNGLELESVSLTSLDQTDIKHMRENNAFDAKGNTKVVERVQQNRERQNEARKQAEIEIAQKDLEEEEEKIRVKREEEELRAQQQAEIAREQEKSEREQEQARIQREQSVEESEIRKEEEVDIADQQRQIAIAEKSKETSKAEEEAAEAEAEAVAAEEQVKTAQATEEAEREKEVALIQARKEEEEEALAITVEAEAEREAAEDEAQAIRTIADAEREEHEVEAEGKRKLNEAENALDSEIIEMKIKLKLLGTMPEVLEKVVKPIEQIDQISMVDTGGMIGGQGRVPADGQSGNDTGVMNNLFDKLAHYQLKMPVLREIMDSAGVTDLTPEGLLSALENEKVGPLDEEALAELKSETEPTDETDSREVSVEEDKEENA